MGSVEENKAIAIHCCSASSEVARVKHAVVVTVMTLTRIEHAVAIAINGRSARGEIAGIGNPIVVAVNARRLAGVEHAVAIAVIRCEVDDLLRNRRAAPAWRTWGIIPGGTSIT
jgi:hypothetical protein